MKKEDEYVSHTIDAKTFHGFSLDPATRSEMATLAGRLWWFALGMLFDSVQSSG